MRFALCLSSLAITLSAQAPISVIAPIQRVRLHPDEAWVTRVGKAKIPSAGAHRLTIADLPSGLGVQDIRVSAKGPQGMALGDFGIGVEARKITESPEYQELKRERDAMQDKIDALEADIQAKEQEVNFLSNFRAAYDKDASTKLVSGSLSGASVVDMSASLSDRLAAVLTGVRRQRRELREQSEEIRRLDLKMRQMASERSASPSRATVEITLQRPGDVEVELTYRSRQARWNPAYEARLAGDDKSLELALFASVTQTSGEDWNSVRLEITNARASRSLVMPRLPGAQIITWSEFAQAQDSDEEVVAKEQGYFRAYSQNIYVQPAAPPEPEAMEMDMKAAAPSEATSIEEFKGLATTWLLEGIKDVPSDGEPHRFRVVSTEVEPTFALAAVPRIDPTVYRVARFPIPSGIPLFPSAPIVHFAGTQRVGESPLAAPGAGQPIQLGFGPYRGVRVALTRVNAKKESVGTFTKEIQWTLQERFEVSNDLNDAVTVEIQDRELRAGNDRVKITFQPERAPATEAQTPGIHCWKLDLSPKTTLNMPFTYLIRVPQSQGRASGIENLNLPE
ncbi:MAG: mucoidy inhibitor MuiA family protein [Holophagales bacterium]|jgi:uncharacterized protein (TIGR02231 family)|nr:mucoidy inhibitor MuiA family protein [Holophagales bacterium]